MVVVESQELSFCRLLRTAAAERKIRVRDLSSEAGVLNLPKSLRKL